MTLIITVATKDYIFQIADTKLTTIDGKLFDDNLVKTTIVHCSDAKLAISYTGLAFINGQRTDKWLVKELKKAEVWKKNFPEVVEFLKNTLTKVASHDSNLEKLGLTLVVVGLGINKGIRDVALALVTNNERPVPQRYEIEHVKPEREFRRYFFNPGNHFTWYMSVHGAVDLTDEINTLRRKIGKKLLQAKTDEKLIELMNYLVAWLRLQRKSKKVGHLIGDDCTVVHIGSDFKGSMFFYSKDKKLRRYPNIVSKELTIVDFVVNPESEKEQL